MFTGFHRRIPQPFAGASPLYVITGGHLRNGEATGLGGLGEQSHNVGNRLF